MKTDRRDAEKLARFYRSGDLMTEVYVDETTEACRACRTHHDPGIVIEKIVGFVNRLVGTLLPRPMERHPITEPVA